MKASRILSSLAVALVLAALAACGGTDQGARLTGAPVSPAAPAAPATSGRMFDHVIVIMLENEDEEDAFNRGAPTRYLSVQLPDQGALLTNFYGIGHHSLDNYLALVSGQAPNRDTQADCPRLTRNKGTRFAKRGQLIGTGCVYPKRVPTVAGQLETAGLSWGEYAQDMAAARGAHVVNTASGACVHPKYGTKDTLARATKTSQYATRHNPWVYFRSIPRKDCVAHDVDLSHLAGDLADPATFPNVAMVTPDLCNDGHDNRCADGVSAGGMTQADRFLAQYVPMITGSATYREGRTMVVVTFDEAENNVSSACCRERSGPNVKKPGIHGPGGGKIGAVVISPRTKPRTYPWQSYNHYGLLATIEDDFGLARLGFAKKAKPFGSDVFNR